MKKTTWILLALVIAVVLIVSGGGSARADFERPADVPEEAAA